MSSKHSLVFTPCSASPSRLKSNALNAVHAPYCEAKLLPVAFSMKPNTRPAPPKLFSGSVRIPSWCYILAMKQRISLQLVVIVVMGAIAIALHAASDQSANYITRTLALPDHGQGNITMDYIAYDPKTGYVWVPAINVGSVY